MAPPKQSLMDSSSDASSSDSDSDSSSSPQTTKLTVNEKFARTFQEKKRTEFLSSAAAKQYDSDDDSSSGSDSEDEDGVMIDPLMDLRIMKTINSIRSKDPTIYDDGKKFFTEEEGTKIRMERRAKSEGKSKRMEYKDVVREQILEEMEEQEGTTTTSTSENRKTLAYDDEQEELRRSFIDNTNESDGDGEEDGDILTKKPTSDADAELIQNDIKTEFAKMKKLPTSSSPLRDPKNEVEDADEFLKNYITSRAWIDEDATKFTSTGLGDYDDEEEELDAVDNFESKYNFRFEEGGGQEIVSYARGGAAHDDSMRRVDDKRKKEREARKDRKRVERQKKEEQLNHLKNQKREEIKSQLGKVKDVSGVEGMDEATLQKLLEGDFDPDQFNKAMADAYDEEYYDDGEGDMEEGKNFDLKKVLGGEVDYEYASEGEEEEKGDVEEEEEEEEEGEDDEVVTEIKEIKSKANKMMDELYQLDYEDLIGDLPTRFKYRQVEKNAYGLSAREILVAPDKELNSYVSLKKLAPYREDQEWRVMGNKRRRFLKQCDEWEAEQDKYVEEEVQDGGYGLEGDGKKKRKKKGKKGEKEVEEKIDNMMEAEEEEGEKKKTRKKKGKKVKKVEGGEEGGEEEKKAPVVVKEKAVVKEKVVVAPKKAEKKKPKKKAEKPSKIKGITQSRLAAYGAA